MISAWVKDQPCDWIVVRVSLRALLFQKLWSVDQFTLALGRTGHTRVRAISGRRGCG